MQEHRGVFVSGNCEGNEMISSLSMVEMIENFSIKLFVMVSHRRKINCILSSSCLLSSIFSLCILLLCSCRVDCYARDILKQGVWIIDDGETTLVSSGGILELGFFTSSHKRFVGIWYKQDHQTVVWVANRDSPVVNGSTGAFGIAEDGNLKVWDNTTGHLYWNISVEISSSANRTVKLMDSGNLVLSNDDDDQLALSLWESFRNPTDTFLPGMKMDESLTLTSWTSNVDPGSGNFTFKQDKDESSSHYVISKRVGVQVQINYWRSWTGNFLSFDDIHEHFEVANLLSNFSMKKCMKHDAYSRCLSEVDSYKRLVMNHTGKLQYLQWDVDSRNWSLEWWAPKDKCSIYDACGKFGSCNVNNWVVCKCLPEFQPTNPGKWNSGDFSVGCARNSTSSDISDMFLSLKMMKVNNPDSPTINANNETECQKQCLDYSQCQAYSFQPMTYTCLIWTEDLSNLQEEYTNSGRNLSVRVAKSVIGTPFTP
jgi:hypothetical protein